MTSKNELAKPTQYQAPAFMQGETETGAEELRQYIVPPRLKVVQGTSRGVFKERFSPGEIVMVPQMVLVAPMKRDDRQRPLDHGESFTFVPLFFFPEWCLWNPIEVRDSAPSVVARSLDPNSEIARRSRDKDRRTEPYMENGEQKIVDGKPLFRRYVEHLNYVIVIEGESDVAGVPMVLSFSRGEHRAGSNFSGLIALRRLPNKQQAPIFGCRFEARAQARSGPKGDWHGIDVFNPTDVCPFVEDADQYAAYKMKYEELKKNRDDIRVEYEDEEPAVDAATTSTEY